MLDQYNDIVNKFTILKQLNSDTELIYNKISSITVELTLNYNNIIKEKDENNYDYDYFENKINDIIAMHDNIVELYSIFINNKSIINNKINEIVSKINDLDEFLTYQEYVYKIRLFSILLNTFIKNFKSFNYDERWIKLKQIKQEYLQYLKNITTINNSLLVSLLHPIYLTPLLMYDNRSEIIVLKDNIKKSVNLNDYYGCISPDIIKYNVKLLDTDIRHNIRNSDINIFDLHLDGTLHFNPDYRNVTYNIEIEAFSVLKSKLKFTFIVKENGFVPILPLPYNNTIKLGMINNNTFSINFKEYYDDRNLLFMVETTSNIDSNLSYDHIYEYKGNFIDAEIPKKTDVIKITPYMKNYPVIYSEYNNTIVELNVISVPKIIKEYITINFDNNQTYYYDLNVMDKWFMNVNKKSIINLTIDNVRQNLKDSTLNVVGLKEYSILYFNPDYRDISYNINVTIQNVDSYSYYNIIYFNIIESSVPKPVRLSNNLLLEHVLIKENYNFNLNKYFNSITGGKLNFSFDIINNTPNIKIDDLFTLNNNFLRLTPDNRNIKFELQIYATDTIYNVISDDYLKIKINEDKVLNKKSDILPLYELGNIKQTINIYEHIKLPNEERYKPGLRYQITYNNDIRNSFKNKKPVATIDDEGLLTINPDYRNMTYTITILVESYEYYTYRDSIQLILNVSEREIHYPIITNKNILIQTIVKNTIYDKVNKTLYVNKLDNKNVKINLNYFFECENSLRYQIMNNNQNNIYTIENNILNINPDLRDIIHTFDILAIDNVYNVFNNNENNLLHVQLTELHPINVIDYKSIYHLSNQNQYINLDDIFKSTINKDLLLYYVQYYENYDIRLNMINLSNSYKQLNNLLILQPDYRGIEYKLNITAFNLNYFDQSKSIEITIIEENKKEIERLLDKLEINLYRFNEENIDNININLEDLYSFLRYYSRYELRLLNMDGNKLINKYINIYLGYLQISKVFDLDFRFQVVLYDLNTDLYLMNKAITIKLIKSKKITIVFHDNSNKKELLIDDISNNKLEIIVSDNKVIFSKTNKLIVNKGNYNFHYNVYDSVTDIIIKQYYYEVKDNTNIKN